MRLISDFTDYYDGAFNGSMPELRRLMSEGPSRREMFHLLEKGGVQTPPHGIVKELTLPATTILVVYLDERSHRGEGKVRMSLTQAKQEHPNAYASCYLPVTPEGLGYSWRYLQLGDQRFLLEYLSAEDWRSNWGPLKVRVISRGKSGLSEKFPYPLFAIDFLPVERELFAVDLNLAPGVRGSGVEDLLPPEEAAAAIERAISLLAAKLRPDGAARSRRDLGE